MADIKRYTFSKNEKLKSRKAISSIFSDGSSIAAYPFRLFYKIEGDSLEVENTKIGVSVSKRNFKHAVDRNRIKRLMRETYRLQKYSLLDNINVKVAVMIVYTQRKELDYSLINKKMKVALEKLSAEIEKSPTTVKQHGL